MLDFLALVALRALLQGLVWLFSPDLPFFVARESRDVLEYLAHLEVGRAHWFEGEAPFIFNVAIALGLSWPSLGVLGATKALIFATDVASAALWYCSTARLAAAGLNKNRHVEGYDFVSSPWFVAALHLLSPFAIVYNQGCNAAGVRYFWVSLAIFAALRLYGYRTGGVQDYVLFQTASTALLLTGSFKMYAVLLPLSFLAVHKRLRLSDDPSLGWWEFKFIVNAVYPHVLVPVCFAMLYNTFMGQSPVTRALELEYGSRGAGIDFSLYWYLHRIVPPTFEVGNLLKAHLTIFLLPLPLLVVLRQRPMEYLISMLNIAILQQPRLSLQGVWFMVCLFAVHYPLLDKGLAFTKLMMVMFGAIIMSVVAYISWVGRYIANPNYYFAPQLIVFMIVCMALEDYTRVCFELWTGSVAKRAKID